MHAVGSSPHRTFSKLPSQYRLFTLHFPANTPCYTVIVEQLWDLIVWYVDNFETCDPKVCIRCCKNSPGFILTSPAQHCFCSYCWWALLVARWYSYYVVGLKSVSRSVSETASVQQKAQCMLCYAEFNSVGTLQRNLRCTYVTDKSISRWFAEFKERGLVSEKPRSNTTWFFHFGIFEKHFVCCKS
jgi:hypothetical protein